jgi:hypothetical protein
MNDFEAPESFLLVAWVLVKVMFLFAAIPALGLVAIWLGECCIRDMKRLKRTYEEL